MLISLSRSYAHIHLDFIINVIIILYIFIYIKISVFQYFNYIFVNFKNFKFLLSIEFTFGDCNYFIVFIVYLLFLQS